MDSEVVQKHRFHDFGPAEEAAVVDGAIPKNTKKANCFWINVFDTFLPGEEDPLRLREMLGGGVRTSSEKVLRWPSKEEW